MADSKVSQLTQATQAAAADLLYLVQSNTSKRLTVGNLFSNVAVDLVPTVNNANSIGSASFRWQNLYVSNINVSGGSASFSNANLSGTVTTVSSNVLPSATNVWNLGNTDLRFRSIWLTGESSIYLGGNTIIRSDANGNVRITSGASTFFANVDGSIKIGNVTVAGPANQDVGRGTRLLNFTNAALVDTANIANVDFGRGNSTIGLGALPGDLAFNTDTLKVMVFRSNVLGFANVA